MKLYDIDRMVKDYLNSAHDLHAVTYYEMQKYKVNAVPVEWLKQYEIKHGQECRLQEALERWFDEQAEAFEKEQCEAMGVPYE